MGQRAVPHQHADVPLATVHERPPGVIRARQVHDMHAAATVGTQALSQRARAQPLRGGGAYMPSAASSPAASTLTVSAGRDSRTTRTGMCCATCCIGAVGAAQAVRSAAHTLLQLSTRAALPSIPW